MQQIQIVVDETTYKRLVAGAVKKGQAISHYASNLMIRFCTPVAEIEADRAGEEADERTEAHVPDRRAL